MTSRTLVALVCALSLAGCFDEGLPEKNLTGTLLISSDLAPDSRDIGPVYIGIYEAYDPFQLGYPYPATGPRIGDNPIGDALPYGGTSVGDFAYGCYQSLRCAIVSGRYESLQSMLDVHPLENEDGEPITDEELFDQCTYYYGWNSLSEFNFIGTSQLDFALNDDGDWEADFKAWHTRVPDGALIWAFADNDNTSCSVDRGAINRKRPEDGLFFREGAHFQDILNFPDKYITSGDFISENPTVLEADRLEGYQVRLEYTFE
jgi:hypothetical protein